jgi:hypothetical protein
MSAWLPLLVNAGIALLGVAQGADWVHIVGSSQTAGVVTAIVAGLNAVAHVFAGAGPASKASASKASASKASASKSSASA